MYRMLIVDDLPIIVRSMKALFEEQDRLPLTLYGAHSGLEALEVLKRTRIDIVLSDIRMPEMDGLDMLKEIRRLWPRCKVIFLTGYSEFEYAKMTVAFGGFDYILKTESEQRIVEAVQRALAAIAEESAVNHLLEQAKGQIRQALPVLQKQLLMQLLQGEAPEESEVRRALAELQIALDPGRPVMLLVARIDDWQDRTAIRDKALMRYALINVVGEHLASLSAVAPVEWSDAEIVWLLQSEHPPVGMATFVFGTLEPLQQVCRELLGLTVSFLLGEQAVAWRMIADRFREMRGKWRWGWGGGHESLLLDSSPGAQRRTDGGSLALQERLGRLDTLLNNNQQEAFFALLEEVLASVREERQDVRRKLLVYHAISAMFIACKTEIETVIDTFELADLRRLQPETAVASWTNMENLFRSVSRQLFDAVQANRKDRVEEIVHTVEQYAAAHIDTDTSLVRLADVAGLSPAYLSRLYKQATGRGLSEYLSALKLQTARRLLQDNRLKIQEVAHALGYNSGLAFTRFFKNQTRMTPQEYRNQCEQDQTT